MNDKPPVSPVTTNVAEILGVPVDEWVTNPDGSRTMVTSRGCIVFEMPFPSSRPQVIIEFES